MAKFVGVMGEIPPESRRYTQWTTTPRETRNGYVYRRCDGPGAGCLPPATVNDRHRMSVSPLVQEILDASGIKDPIGEIPPGFSESPSPLADDALFDLMFSAPIDDSSDDSPRPERDLVIGAAEDEDTDRKVQERLDLLREIVRAGDVPQARKLMQLNKSVRGRKCADAECPGEALTGSDFCINHIVQDPRQKLFRECPNCRRPSPVGCRCLFCDSL